MAVLIEGGYDATRSGTLSVTITETGGGGLSKTVTLTSKYMPSTDCTTIKTPADTGATTNTTLGYASMLSTLQTGFSTGLTSAITVSIVNRQWRFSSNGAGGVTAIAVTYGGAGSAADYYFGFNSATYSGALTHTLQGYASRYMVPAENGVTDLTEPHEVADDLAAELISNSGGYEGLAMPGALYEMEFVVPLEPQARLWHRYHPTNDLVTWELFFRQCRNIEPILLSGLNVSGTAKDYAMKLRADSCAFVPEQLADDYLAYANVRLRAAYLGSTT